MQKTKTARANAKKPIRKLVKAAVRSKIPVLRKAARSVVPSQPNYVRKLNPLQAIQDSPAEASAKNVAALLEPWAVAPGAGNTWDATNRPTFRWSTRSTVTLTSAQEGGVGNYRSRLLVNPYLLKQTQDAKTWSGGQPSADNNANDPSYGTVSGFVDAYRCVALGVKIYNSTAVTSWQGMGYIGRISYGASDTYTTGQLANSREFCVVSLTHPGDIFKMTWAPVTGYGAFSDDMSWKEYNAAVDSDATSLYFRSESANPLNLTAEVVAHFEAIVLTSAQSVYTPTEFIGDPSVTSELYQSALSRMPFNDKRRVVESEDGPVDSVIQDGTAIVDFFRKGGYKSLSGWSSFGKGVMGIGKAVGSVAGLLGSLLGARERLHRRLCDIPDDEMRELVVLLEESKGNWAAARNTLEAQMRELTAKRTLRRRLGAATAAELEPCLDFGPVPVDMPTGPLYQPRPALYGPTSR